MAGVFIFFASKRADFALFAKSGSDYTDNEDIGFYGCFIRGRQMDLYDSFFSPGGVLIEQVGRQIFEILPEGGPVVVITDRQGNFWPSDSARFDSLNISHSHLRDICERIDDGIEPVISAEDQVSIVGAQLATDKTKCGYVFIVLEHYSPESTLANIDLGKTTGLLVIFRTSSFILML